MCACDLHDSELGWQVHRRASTNVFGPAQGVGLSPWSQQLHPPWAHQSQSVVQALAVVATVLAAASWAAVQHVPQAQASHFNSVDVERSTAAALLCGNATTLLIHWRVQLTYPTQLLRRPNTLLKAIVIAGLGFRNSVHAT